MTAKGDSTTPWKLVAYRTPAAPSTARVSAWRTLHRMGALYLGPTVCLLPAQLADAGQLEALGRRVEAAGGAFEVLAIEAFGDAAEAAVRARCNEARDAEYAEIVERAQALVDELEREGARGKFTFAEVEENEADLAKLRRWLGRVTARDLFGAPSRGPAEDAVGEAERRLTAFVEQAIAREAEATGAATPEREQAGLRVVRP